MLSKWYSILFLANTEVVQKSARAVSANSKRVKKTPLAVSANSQPVKKSARVVSANTPQYRRHKIVFLQAVPNNLSVSVSPFQNPCVEYLSIPNRRCLLGRFDSPFLYRRHRTSCLSIFCKSLLLCRIDCLKDRIDKYSIKKRYETVPFSQRWV